MSVTIVTDYDVLNLEIDFPVKFSTIKLECSSSMKSVKAATMSLINREK